MTREELFEYVKDEYGIEPDYPFDKDFTTGVLRHKSNKKWFALVMVLPKNKVYGDCDNIVEVVNLKCDPMLRGSLLGEKGIYTAYHMNKVHWVTLVLSEASEENVKTLIDLSFSLTKK